MFAMLVALTGARGEPLSPPAGILILGDSNSEGPFGGALYDTLRALKDPVAAQAFHPAFQDKLPYIVATIALEEQGDLRMVSNMVDCSEDDLSMDAPVQVTFREVATDLVLPLFTLVTK